MTCHCIFLGAVYLWWMNWAGCYRHRYWPALNIWNVRWMYDRSDLDFDGPEIGSNCRHHVFVAYSLRPSKIDTKSINFLLISLAKLLVLRYAYPNVICNRWQTTEWFYRWRWPIIWICPSRWWWWWRAFRIPITGAAIAMAVHVTWFTWRHWSSAIIKMCQSLPATMELFCCTARHLPDVTIINGIIESIIFGWWSQRWNNALIVASATATTRWWFNIIWSLVVVVDGTLEWRHIGATDGCGTATWWRLIVIIAFRWATWIIIDTFWLLWWPIIIWWSNGRIKTWWRWWFESTIIWRTLAIYVIITISITGWPFQSPFRLFHPKMK